MTPHGVLESMLDAGPAHGGLDKITDQVDLRVWPDVMRALGAAVHFELGEARPTEEHEEFAFDLFERDLFRLPFPVTFWTGRASPSTAFLFHEEDPASWRPTGEHAGGARGIGLIIIGQMLDRANNRAWTVPLVSGRISATPLGADGNVRFSWRGLTQDAMSRKTGEKWGEDKFAAAIDKASRLVFGSTAMLMTPDIDLRIASAPDKLNAQRERKGRPPVGERRTIIIRPHARDALSGLAAQLAFDGRKAIRPHMRRGHFRTIYRGTEVERVVPVAPCVVGVTADAREQVRPKDYVLGRPRINAHQ